MLGNQLILGPLFKVGIKVVIVKLWFLLTFRLKVLVLFKTPAAFLRTICKPRILELNRSFRHFQFFLATVTFGRKIIRGFHQVQVRAHLLTLSSFCRLSSFPWFDRLSCFWSFYRNLLCFLLGLLESLRCFYLSQGDTVLRERKIGLADH